MGTLLINTIYVKAAKADSSDAKQRRDLPSRVRVFITTKRARNFIKFHGIKTTSRDANDVRPRTAYKSIFQQDWANVLKMLKYLLESSNPYSLLEGLASMPILGILVILALDKQ